MCDKQCGLCFANFTNLKQHLVVSHCVPNKDEFQLLMAYGNARTTDKLDCEICGKKELVRLDKHLLFTHIITSAEEREPVIKQAKKAAIVKKLAALRETCPQVPMVSFLDKGIEETGQLSKMSADKVVQDFLKFQLGAQRGRKGKEKARQTASHAYRFCLYMAAGLPSQHISQNLRFLTQLDKLRSWPICLQQKGYGPTTMKNIMNSVVLFVKHIQKSFLSVSMLRSKDIDKIQYEMKRLTADIQQKVVVNRQKVLNKTVKEMPFMKEAPKKITELFECLKGNGPQQNAHAMVMGYIMAYLSIQTGHRSIVFTNMTRANVAQCKAWDNGKRFQILVESFGDAEVILSKEEFAWLVNLTSGMCCSHGQACPYVFHTTQGSQILKPLYFIQMAWDDSGMKGSITFNKIRSSVSTQAQKYLSAQERREVAKAMCHDPQTAEKSYVLLPDKKTGKNRRNLRIKALKRAEKSPSSSDENEEDEPLLTDSPETSSDDEEPLLYNDSDMSLS